MPASAPTRATFVSAGTLALVTTGFAAPALADMTPSPLATPTTSSTSTSTMDADAPAAPAPSAPAPTAPAPTAPAPSAPATPAPATTSTAPAPASAAPVPAAPMPATKVHTAPVSAPAGATTTTTKTLTSATKAATTQVTRRAASTSTGVHAVTERVHHAVAGGVTGELSTGAHIAATPWAAADHGDLPTVQPAVAPAPAVARHHVASSPRVTPTTIVPSPAPVAPRSSAGDSGLTSLEQFLSSHVDPRRAAEGGAGVIAAGCAGALMVGAYRRRSPLKAAVRVL